jgi:SAM-dependent methyltransferase
MVNWDSIYKEKGAFQVEVSPRVVAGVASFKTEGARRVLDLGCGTGRHTRYLVDQGFEVFACDSSSEALDEAARLAPEATLGKCDFTSLPYEDSFFDAILCNHVIQHGFFDDVRKAVGEIVRVLKPGGFLFLVAVSTSHPKALTGREVEPNTRIDTDALDGHLPHHFFSETELRELFSGLEVVSLEHVERPSELEPSRWSAAWELRARKP